MKHYWPAAVVVLIGSALFANLALLVLATSDPGFGVEPDYYAKALAWDERRAQERHNADLGWTLQLNVAPALSADGARTVEVRLLDESAAPIGDASVHLTAFHNARSAVHQQKEMRLRDDGTYTCTLRFGRPGLWEFRFKARRGRDVFTETMLEDVGLRPLRRARPVRQAQGRP